MAFHGLIVAGLCFAHVSSELTDVVQTDKGPVRGMISTTIWNSIPFSSFLGIPFAKPPTGNLRFKPPVEADPWEDVLQATSDGNKCLQIDNVYENMTGSEDCLFLNVYTPVTKFKDSFDSLLPVMVWIYGGSFLSGYKNMYLYGPDFLIEEDVILVSVNYRLGAFGFLALGHVNASGNAGIKDQNMALKWVRRNIERFGGDKDRVTLFGESAGGLSVDMHLISPKSRGLFQQSISMSATLLAPWGFFSPEDAKSQAFAIGENLGCPTNSTDELLKCLSEADAVELLQATIDATGTIGLPPLRPTIENSELPSEAQQFIVDCPLNYYNSGNYTKQPHMMGYVAHEANLFAKTPADAVSYINGVLEFANKIDFTNLFAPGFTVAQNISSTALQEALDTVTDLLFVAPIDSKQKVLAKTNTSPIYYYRVSYDSVYSLHRVIFNIELNGTAHADDCGLIFYAEIADAPRDKDHPFSIFRKKMVTLWANFAKYGDPTHNGLDDPQLDILWPDSREDGKQCDIDDELTVNDRLASAQALVYQGILDLAAPVYLGCTSVLGAIGYIF